MIKINLLPPQHRIARWPVKNIFAASLAVLLIVVAIFFSVGEYRIWRLQQDLDAVRREYQLALPIRNKMNIANEKTAVMKQKQGIISQLSQGKKLRYEVLERLGMIVEPGVWLTEVSCTAEKELLMIKGEAVSYTLVADLMTQLGQDDLFYNPVLVNSQTGTQQAIQFEINVKVK